MEFPTVFVETHTCPRKGKTHALTGNYTNRMYINTELISGNFVKLCYFRSQSSSEKNIFC